MRRMMKERKAPYLSLPGEFDRHTDAAMTPASIRFILIVGEVGVTNQEIRPASKLGHRAHNLFVGELDIGGIHDRSARVHHFVDHHTVAGMSDAWQALCFNTEPVQWRGVCARRPAISVPRHADMIFQRH